MAKGGDEHEQAAAIAVVTQSIIESRRLGRIATGTPSSSWNLGGGQLLVQRLGDRADKFSK